MVRWSSSTKKPGLFYQEDQGVFSLQHSHSSSLPQHKHPIASQGLSMHFGESPMEGVPSPSPGAFDSKAVPPAPPQPSATPPHTQLNPGTWSPPGEGYSCYLLNTLLPPSLTAPDHNVGELPCQNSSTRLGSLPHLPDTGTQLQWAADAVMYLAYMYLNALVQPYYKKFSFR